MANYCIFCGEEIPEDQAACNTCPAILDSLPPDRAKRLEKLLEDEEARIKFRTGIQVIKLQLRLAIKPVVECIFDFIDSLLAATEEIDDG